MRFIDDREYTVMSGILDSPFIRAFTATNSFVLGAGALYLIAACGETEETAPTNLSLLKSFWTESPEADGTTGTLQSQSKQAHRGKVYNIIFGCILSISVISNVPFNIS